MHYGGAIKLQTLYIATIILCQMRVRYYGRSLTQVVAELMILIRAERADFVWSRNAREGEEGRGVSRV